MAKTKKTETEKNRIAGRARRYAAIGGRMSGVAAKAATKRILGIKVDKNKEAEELKRALGGLKGPLMKIAQILGTIPDAIPEEYTLQLRELQTAAPSMGWGFVRRRMAAELGADWQNQFSSFDQIASAAASLGQVHKAVTKNGDTVACKLQYPDMASSVDADLNQLKLILKIYGQINGAIDTKDVYQEISDRLREELDYRQEARNIDYYRMMLKNEKTVHIPHVFPKLSTGRLLTMQWLDGKPIMDFQSRTQSDRNIIATNMFRAWYVPFYNYGIIHGDPHMGNYTVRQDLSINLLDFGCIRIFSPKFVSGVIDLYTALRDDKPDLAVAAYKNWGFENLNKNMIDVLNIWARFLYDPILQDKKLNLGESNTGAYGRETAAKVHAELRKIGGVRPPREFVFMDRAAVGLGSVFIHLKADINWYRLFHDLIGGFDRKTLQHNQANILG